MIPRGRRFFSGAGGALAWLLIGAVIGALAALLFSVAIQTTVTTRADNMVLGSFGTDDDAVVLHANFDAGDNGLSDPAGIGPNAARSTPNIATCIITSTGALSFNVAMSGTYPDGWCSVRINLQNTDPTLAMTVQPLTVNTGTDPVAIAYFPTSVGKVFPAAMAGSSPVELSVHVLSGAAAGVTFGPYAFAIKLSP